MALLLAGGVAVAAGRRAPVAWSWAAALPAAAITALRAFGPAAAAGQGTACSVVGSPRVGWAVAEGALAAAIVTVLALLLAAKPAELGLRRLPRYAIPWAVAGFAAILGGGLAIVLVGGPLLGVTDLDLGGAGFLAPAAVFAVAVAVAEELAWRGALGGWLARSLGPGPAALVQGGVYGVAWGVALGSPGAGVAAAMCGVVLGATVVRTRSLGVALAWHVAFNVPFYALIACRTG
jgi:membrane protease YdiL (CAAX protease family)